ncbi:PLP-dependent aminotransferase family protein [Curtobacterium sp. PhB136]|uniref:MocR-like pyridoxine biosynthesis transcription factor PdxR n=1 Tax=Curtobacterium sp. PhB136 TaxID=2485181 RepID=UPI001045DE07|nr:PLP-dependent aminotransferase family protein [Curtobacterium sp. PhB136]TCK59308.1 GntR family transcriptional regulator/MocR family aminotransferase [Curtobacterium sp. PhB136]
MDQFGKTAGVVARIRGMVHDGTLRSGDALPSTRALAAELGVARGTVVAAYEQLDGEGYIRTRHGAAARVAASVDGPVPVGAAAGVPVVPGVSAASAAAGASATGAPAAPSDAAPTTTVIDCRPGIPAVTAISDRDWRAAWRAAADLPIRNALSDPLGLPALREQVAAQLGLSRGFAPDPRRVVMAAGTSEALSLVTEALRVSLGRAPRIAVEDPGYRTGHRAVVNAGGEVVGVPLDEDGLDLDVLRAGGRFDAVMVTPTHQYPLGSVMPVARRRALLDWADATGTLVIEDDYDSEFRHRGQPVPALAALDPGVLHVGGFSKSFDPRLRCAYVVLPAGRPDVALAVTAARVARGAVVAEPVQAAVAHLLRTGAFRRHLGRVRRDYTHRRALIVARLTSAAGSVPGLEARALTGGLHTVVSWSGPLRGAAVVGRLASRGVLVADLADYEVTAGSAGEGVVLGYGAVSLPALERALDALVEVLGAGCGSVTG